MFKYRKLRCKVEKVFWKIVCVFAISFQLGAAIVIKPRPQIVSPTQPEFSNDAAHVQLETVHTSADPRFSNYQTYALPSDIASQQLQPLSRGVDRDERRPGSEIIPTQMFQPVQAVNGAPLKPFAPQNFMQHRTVTVLSPYNTQATFESNHFNAYGNGASPSIYSYTGEFNDASLIPEIHTNCYNCGGSDGIYTPGVGFAPTVNHEYHFSSWVQGTGR